MIIVKMQSVDGLKANHINRLYLDWYFYTFLINSYTILYNYLFINYNHKNTLWNISFFYYTYYDTGTSWFYLPPDCSTPLLFICNYSLFKSLRGKGYGRYLISLVEEFMRNELDKDVYGCNATSEVLQFINYEISY